MRNTIVISRVIDARSRELVGYLMSESGKPPFIFTLDSIERAYKSGGAGALNEKLYNAKFDAKGNFVGVGRNFDNIPTITNNYDYVNGEGYAIAYLLQDVETKKIIGAYVFNAIGRGANIPLDKVVAFVKDKRVVCTNFTVKDDGYGNLLPYPLHLKESFVAVPTNLRKQPDEARFIHVDATTGQKVVTTASGAVVDTSTTPQPVKRRGRPPKNAATQPTTPIIPNKEDFKSEEDKIKEQIEDLVQKDAEVKKIVKAGYPVLEPVVFDTSKYNPNMLKGANQKMYLAKLNVRKLAPYYGVVLDSVEQVRSEKIETLAVSEDKLFYNLSFVAQISVAELSFVLLHEVSHICMQHVIRRGQRDPYLWNVATDLYVNTILAHDFGLSIADTEDTVINDAVIRHPQHLITLESINEVLDLTRDTPETIYARLIAENEEQMQQQQNGGQGQDSEQGSGSGQSQEQNGSQGQKQNQGQGGGTSQDGDQNQGQGSNGDGQSGEGQSGEGSDSNSQGKGQRQGNKSDSQGDSSSNNDSNGQGNNSQPKPDLGEDYDEHNEVSVSDYLSEEGKGKGKRVRVTYNGKQIDGYMFDDMRQSSANPQNQTEKSKQVLSRVRMAKKKMELEVGEDLAKMCGAGAGVMQRFIDFGLSQTVDWSELLRSRCIDNKNGLGEHRPQQMSNKREIKRNMREEKRYTYTRMNSRYLAMGAFAPTKTVLQRPKRASNFAICMDVSGSVSDTEMNVFISEVANLTQMYNVEADLLYWSTEVGDAGKISDLQDILRIKPDSTGGTDVSCVFEYFLGNAPTMTGKYYKDKLAELKTVIIFTDGCFSANYGKYAEQFGGKDKVIWMIDHNPELFKPLFGKVVPYVPNEH